MPEESDAISRMALNFYGFGRWDAPYWFIGQEPGLAIDDLHQVANAWNSEGAGELLDCRSYHLRGLRDRRWHELGKCQATWRRMIFLLLASTRQVPERERRELLSSCARLFEYQKHRWGSTQGETAILDLSSIPGINLGHAEATVAAYFKPGEFKHVLATRLDYIRKQLETSCPRLLVCYGTTHMKSWNRLLGTVLREGVSERLSFGNSGRETVAVLTRAPAAHGLTQEYWLEIARQLHL